jgi:TolB protein
MPTLTRTLLGGCLLLSGCALLSSPLGPLGVFEGETDVGTVSRPGSAVYDPQLKTYTVGSSGANMWFRADAMHYVWKKASGDLSLAADIGFVGTSKQNHRKACLVIRQNLEPGSPYVDVAVHGDGLTSLQFRDAQDGTTREIQSMVATPARVRLDKIGDTVYLSVARSGEDPAPSGASFRLAFAEPFYVGLAVSAHDNAAFESAVFSKVEVGPASADAAKPAPGLRILTLPSGDRRVTDK